MIFAATKNYVREVIHAFYQQGFAGLVPNGAAADQLSSVRPPVTRVCRIARPTPSSLGQPFTRWSISKLFAYLHEHHRLIVSGETARRVLHRTGTTSQHTEIWKVGRDPAFATKITHILDFAGHSLRRSCAVCR